MLKRGVEEGKENMHCGCMRIYEMISEWALKWSPKFKILGEKISVMN